MTNLLFFFLLLLIPLVVFGTITSPANAAEPTPVPLWAGGKVPNALGTRPEDIPTLTPYLLDATAATPRPAMVICPGGGYGGLADHEGRDYALFLNQQNIVCFVLKYRLGSGGYRHPVMLEDAARAVRTVRTRAAEWNIDPNRVGIMGSSAGGHLASTLLTHFDAGKADDPDPVERQSSRPSLGVLCYAVISMQEGLTHAGSRQNLLGDFPAKSLVDGLSNERQVTPQTPPCFLWHTGEDTAVKVENSLAFAGALQSNKVPFDLHVYQKGRHGIGLLDKDPFANVHPWASDLVFWLKAQGWVLRDDTK
ncbi:MAG: alpha/beta hydrolase [Akkermansiaceae bacterium]|nr:alpha/beta hydrolase [Armatimonadota bacterium]